MPVLLPIASLRKAVQRAQSVRFWAWPLFIRDLAHSGTRMNRGRSRIALATAVGFSVGGVLGKAVGLGIRSDNLPFLIAFGAVVGVCIGVAIGFALNWRRGA